MTCPDCEKEVFGASCSCGWKPPLAVSKPLTPLQDASRGPVMSLDEFGPALFHAIGRCASLRHVRKMIALSQDRLNGRDKHPERYRWQRELSDDRTKEQELVKEVVDSLGALSPDDHAFVVARYRDVLA